jgi:Na+-translocating ferredoxin:NAD+ oxidoreductase subunit G
MPEQQQQKPRPGEELVLEPKHSEVAAERQAASGAGTISPTIVVPPVVIAVVMSFLLALVYGITETPIAEAKKADKRDKLGEVMPAFENDPLDSEKPLTDAAAGRAGNVMLYTGESGGQISGYGITSAVGTGYSGYFSVVFGLDAEGNVTEVKILESMETPGLGSKAGEPDFTSQFTGQNLNSFNFSVTKDGGDVDAITGATITSRAVSDAIRQGLENFSPGEAAPAAEDSGDDAAEPGAEYRGGWQRPGGGS